MATSRRTCISFVILSERSESKACPERGSTHEPSRTGTCVCLSRPSLSTKRGCPILAALLFLRLGWGSTNPICRVSYQRSAGRSGIHLRLPQTAALFKTEKYAAKPRANPPTTRPQDRKTLADFPLLTNVGNVPSVPGFPPVSSHPDPLGGNSLRPGSTAQTPRLQGHFVVT